VLHARSGRLPSAVSPTAHSLCLEVPAISCPGHAGAARGIASLCAGVTLAPARQLHVPGERTARAGRQLGPGRDALPSPNVGPRSDALTRIPQSSLLIINAAHAGPSSGTRIPPPAPCVSRSGNTRRRRRGASASPRIPHCPTSLTRSPPSPRGACACRPTAGRSTASGPTTATGPTTR